MLRRSKGFSLVEVLVAIGILAILMGILIPSISKVRAAAATSTCMNNQRQLVMAVIMFTRDHEDHLPNTGWSHGNTDNWAYSDAQPRTYVQSEVERGQIWKYVNNYQAYRCPRDIGPWAGTSFNNLASFCLNGACTAYGGSVAVPAGSTNPSDFVGLSILRFKSEDVVFWELCPTAGGTNGAGDGTNYPSEGVTARHKRGTVISHMDGHVDLLPADDTSGRADPMVQTRDFIGFCNPNSAVNSVPNILYCDPTSTDAAGKPDGGLHKASGYAWPIKVQYE